ncbi:MAG TPA: hypothetical protein VGM39_16890 [Kofleriaceae bacterium]
MGIREGLVVAAALGAFAACGDNLEGTTQRTECKPQSGHACVWAGKSGVEGFNGDGLDRRDTEIYWSMDMLFASDGVPWFIDWNNHLVRRVDNDIVTSVVGWIDPPFPGDGLSGNSESTPDGALGTDVKLNHPTDLAETDDGHILVMAWHNHKLREINPATGHVRILAGNGPGFAGDGMAMNTALFKQPKSLVRTPNGDLYILDQQNFRVRKVAHDTGVITTIAGGGMQGTDGDNGPAVMAKLDFAAGSNPEPSGGLAVLGDKVYIADSLANRIRVVDQTTGMITAFAGTGTEGYSGDGGAALSAQLSGPRDIEIGPDGDLYFADTDNNVIRAINLTTNQIRTVAGTGELGLDPVDGKLATETLLARPFGIEFSPEGHLFICDTINSRILEVTP